MIPLATQLGMLLRRTPVRRLGQAFARVEREKLPLTLTDLEAEYLRGGSPEALIASAIAVRTAGLPIRKATLVEALDLGVDPVQMLQSAATLVPGQLSLELLEEQAPRRPEAAKELARRYIDSFNLQPRTLAEMKLGWFVRRIIGKEMESIHRRTLEALAQKALKAIALVPADERASLPTLRHDG
jgi:hypothetical protein